jgi:hypothetical protein
MVFIQDIPIWRWGILPVLVLGFLTYIFSAEINHYWLNRYPVEIDQREHQFLIRHLIFYQQLSPLRQKEFGKSCINFHRQRDFILQGMPNFPDDLKVLLAGQVIFLNKVFEVSLDDWDPYDKIVLYPHPFMSPEIEKVHASETHVTEGVWLFSIDQLIPGMTQPQRFFNIGLYEFLRTLKMIKPHIFEKLEQFDIKELMGLAASFSKIDYKNIQYWLNIDKPDKDAVYLTLLLTNYPLWFNFSAGQLEALPLALAIKKRIQTGAALAASNELPR